MATPEETPDTGLEAQELTDETLEAVSGGWTALATPTGPLNEPDATGMPTNGESGKGGNAGLL